MINKIDKNEIRKRKHVRVRKKLSGTSDMKKVRDMKGNPLLLFVHEWSVGMTLDRNKGLKLSEFGGWEEEG